MSTGTHLITAEQFAGMHFEVPVELVRGEIVFLHGEDGMTRPNWEHGLVCGNIGAILREWSRRQKAGVSFTNDSGVITERDPDSVRGPDVFFVSRERLPPRSTWQKIPPATPNLCVEVWSPSDRWREVHRKIQEYLDSGVKEVWIVFPNRHTVEVFRADEPPVILGENEQLESPELAGFSCRISELFLDGIEDEPV